MLKRILLKQKLQNLKQCGTKLFFYMKLSISIGSILKIKLQTIWSYLI